LEPLCTPCPRIGVAIRVCELVRRWMLGRTRKNEQTKVPIGVQAAEQTRDVPPTVDVEPLPMLTMTDVDLRCLESYQHVVAGAESCGDRPRSVPFDVRLFVCLEGAVRLPEAMFACKSCTAQRALLYAASSHASYVADVGGAVSAGRANEAINSSKKISVSPKPSPTPSASPLVFVLAVPRRQHVARHLGVGRLRRRPEQPAARLPARALLGDVHLARRHGHHESRTCAADRTCHKRAHLRRACRRAQ